MANETSKYLQTQNDAEIVDAVREGWQADLDLLDLGIEKLEARLAVRIAERAELVARMSL